MILSSWWWYYMSCENNRMSPSIASKVYINCLQTPSHHRKTYHLHQQNNRNPSSALESNGKTINGSGNGINGCNGTSNLVTNGANGSCSRPCSRSSSPSATSSWFPERFNNFFASMSPLHSKRSHHLNSPKPSRARTGSISSNHESGEEFLTPVGSPSISSVERGPPGTPLHWKSRLNTLKMSFLGTPRFHRRKMGCSFGTLASGNSPEQSSWRKNSTVSTVNGMESLNAWNFHVVHDDLKFWRAKPVWTDSNSCDQ